MARDLEADRAAAAGACHQEGHKKNFLPVSVPARLNASTLEIVRPMTQDEIKDFFDAASGRSRSERCSAGPASIMRG